MNTNTQFLNRSEFANTINPIRVAHTVRAANLDFFGPIALVCALGVVAHFVQSLFM